MHPTREESFLNVFGQIEQLLKNRLGLAGDDYTPVAQLSRQYASRNPYWTNDARDLDHFRRIRNFLTHERSEEHGFPVHITERSHSRLVEIRGRLEVSVPIAANHKKKVVAFASDNTLAEVIKVAYARQFSQFPIVDGNRFCGVVTENEITRWLGRSVESGQPTVDFEKVLVREVLGEKEPGREGMDIYLFTSLTSPEQEVMGQFMTHPMLEVVFLTQTGVKTEAIEGMVTQWDAARYPAAG